MWCLRTKALFAKKTSKITGNLQNMNRGEKENFKRANKLSFFTGAACRALAKHRVYTPR